MLNFLTKSVTKFFGTKSERDVKELTPYVGKVNAEFEKLRSLTHDQLREQTFELKNIIRERLQPIEDQIQSLRQRVNDEFNMGLDEKEAIFTKIDELGKESDKQLEVVLLDILPRAFAIVKETARRFSTNEVLEVTALPYDRIIAAKRASVSIEDGDKAHWKNRWMAAGNEIVWDMVHYDVQIIGGVVLHQGKISEMATGEGKTLVATFPAFLNALAGKGVHIVTVNDYLAKRDSEWMGPLFEFHGLTIDCIDKHQPNTEARRNAYAADITYGTNNEFGFDYLRDNMAREVGELVQRKHHYAMVDEVDSVLIDDARTPLIIAGPVSRSDEQIFYDLKPRVHALVEAQKQLTLSFLNDAKKKIASGDEKEGGLALFRAFRGLPKNKPLIRYLGEQGTKAVLQKTENYYLQDNQRMMPEADEPLLFTIDEKNNQVELTEKGIDYITKSGEDPHFFILPDLSVELGKIEKNKALTDSEKLQQKESLISDYSAKSERIHVISQLLKAYTLFENDVEYIIQEGKVKIVDEQTGRIMEGRRYSDGLHQAIEAKENVKVEEATQTYATVTLQNYFRMYHKLAGMTGTAETEAGEFWQIYKLDVVVIPTNRPTSREDREDKVYRSVREKYNAVVDEIVGMVEKGRPVLVGTTSVENSEILSRMLNMRKIKHQVLNAKQHQREAEVVAEAGKPGTVTIATNMAGRGTDIKLTPESKAAGGLAIIGTERHEARRVDRQLRGRAGRQGDPGTSQFFVSLEDSLMRLFGSDRIAKLMDRMGLEEGEVIQHSMITKSIERAQRKVEENNFGIRKRLLEYDDVMNYQREAIYRRRRNALFGDRVQLDILDSLRFICENIIENTTGNAENFRLEVLRTLGFETTLSDDEFRRLKADLLADKLYFEAEKHYFAKETRISEKAMPVLREVFQNRGAHIQDVVVPFTDGVRQIAVAADLKKVVESDGRELIRSMEKITTLALIDQEWKEHLRDMDDLKQSVQNAVFEQKDPLLIYKFEAVELFRKFVARVNGDVISFLMKAEIPVEDSSDVQEARQQTRRPQPKLQTSKEEYLSPVGSDHDNGTPMAQQPMPVEKINPIRVQKLPNRNDIVSVQYTDGSIKRDVKFKKVEEDFRNNRCVLID
jgi:preprotein translocase subunit SecA